MSNAPRTYTATEWRIALGLLVVSLVGFGIYQMTDSPTKPNEHLIQANMQRLSEGYVKAHLKDPSSAQFKNQRGACGEVNSKNGFGGYTGFKRYIGASKTLVIIEGESGLSDSEFSKFWGESCN